MPCFSIPFSVRTNIKSALRMVVRRWAMVNTVLPFASSSREFCTRRSLSLSRGDVASSKMIMGGFLRNTRTMLILCFWPPESFTPRSPHSGKSRRTYGSDGQTLVDVGVIWGIDFGVRLAEHGLPLPQDVLNRGAGFQLPPLIKTVVEHGGHNGHHKNEAEREATLCNLLVQPACAAFLCNPLVQPSCAAPLCNLLVPPPCATFLCSVREGKGREGKRNKRREVKRRKREYSYSHAFDFLIKSKKV